MGNNRRPKRKPEKGRIEGPFIQLTKEMLHSKKYRALRHSTRSVYSNLFLKSNLTQYDRTALNKKAHNGGFEYPFSSMARDSGVDPSTAQAAIKELIEAGFLLRDHTEPVVISGTQLPPNVYRLSDKWKDKNED